MLSINNLQHLKYLKSITWEDTLKSWAKEEANLPHWIEHYKERGFKSWEEWRKDSIKNLTPEELDWKLFEVLEPTETIPYFHAGPFRAWIKKYYGNKAMPPFIELAKNLEIQDDPNINEIIQKFPKESALLGLIKDDKIVIIDGLHRSLALAVAHEKGINIKAKVFITLAEFSREIPMLGQINSPT